MARKKKPAAETLEDLSERAATLPGGFLDDELRDAVDLDARLTLEAIRVAPVLDQLEFLHARGYQIGRLTELIREAEQP